MHCLNVCLLYPEVWYVCAAYDNNNIVYNYTQNLNHIIYNVDSFHIITIIMII